MEFKYSEVVRPLVLIIIILGFVGCGAFGQANEISGNYAQAEAYVRAKHWDEGISLLRPLLRSDPQNLKALNLLGIALTGKGELRNANQHFEHALQISPQFLPSLKNLGINEFTLREISAAERHLEEASKLAPDDLVVHAYLGEIAYSRHNYRAAANNLSRAGALLSEDQNVAAHLAVSCLKIGESPKALQVLDQVDANRLNPRDELELGLALASHDFFKEAIPYLKVLEQSYPDSYDLGFNLAICYIESKQFPQAIEMLRKLADRGHNTSEVKNLMGEAYEGNKQTQEAIQALREATLLAPEDENNYLDLAALCMNHDAYDVGTDVINVGLHYHPQSDRLIFQRGLLHAMQNQFELAERDFQLASHVAPEKNFSYIGLSVSYIQTGNLQEAIRLLRRRTHEKPNDFMLQYLLGEALVRSGIDPGDPSLKEAQAALEKSIRLNPEFASGHVVLAKTFLEQNRIQDAVGHLERARALDPKEEAVYAQLAIAYRRQGKPDLAKEMLTLLTALNEQERSQSRGRARLVREDPPQGVRTNNNPGSPNESGTARPDKAPQ